MSRGELRALSAAANPLGSLGDWLSSAANAAVLSETPLLIVKWRLWHAANLLSAAAGLLRAAAAALALREVAF